MNETSPAYLLIGLTQPGNKPKTMPPEVLRYVELARRAAAQVGVAGEIIGRGVAGGSLTILEGAYDGGTLVLERFPSMEGLHKFWHSTEYEQAKKLRTGAAFPTFHFVVALAGVAPEESGDAPGKGPLGYTITCGFGDAPADPHEWAQYLKLSGSIDRGYTPQTLVLAMADRISVLEGDWPYPGGVQIKAHASVDAVVDFWQHPTYTRAKKHRNALALQAVIAQVQPTAD